MGKLLVIIFTAISTFIITACMMKTLDSPEAMTHVAALLSAVTNGTNSFMSHALMSNVVCIIELLISLFNIYLHILWWLMVVTGFEIY